MGESKHPNEGEIVKPATRDEALTNVTRLLYQAEQNAISNISAAQILDAIAGSWMAYSQIVNIFDNEAAEDDGYGGEQ